MYEVSSQGKIMAEKIKLAQGAGGQMMDKLIKEKILKYFEKASESAEIPLSMLDDSAVVMILYFLPILILYNQLFFLEEILVLLPLQVQLMIYLLWVQNQLLSLLVLSLKKG